MHCSQRWKLKENLPPPLQSCESTPRRSLLLETGLGAQPHAHQVCATCLGDVEERGRMTDIKSDRKIDRDL